MTLVIHTKKSFIYLPQVVVTGCYCHRLTHSMPQKNNITNMNHLSKFYSCLKSISLLSVASGASSSIDNTNLPAFLPLAMQTKN